MTVNTPFLLPNIYKRNISIWRRRRRVQAKTVFSCCGSTFRYPPALLNVRSWIGASIYDVRTVGEGVQPKSTQWGRLRVFSTVDKIQMWTRGRVLKTLKLCERNEWMPPRTVHITEGPRPCPWIPRQSYFASLLPLNFCSLIYHPSRFKASSTLKLFWRFRVQIIRRDEKVMRRKTRMISNNSSNKMKCKHNKIAVHTKNVVILNWMPFSNKIDEISWRTHS